MPYVSLSRHHHHQTFVSVLGRYSPTENSRSHFFRELTAYAATVLALGRFFYTVTVLAPGEINSLCSYSFPFFELFTYAGTDFHCF